MRGWILVLSPARQRPECPISLSIPSFSGPQLWGLIHLLCTVAELGMNSQACGAGGREVAAQGRRACSSSAGSLVISRDTGLDCSQKRRLFPRLPAFLSSTQGIGLVVLVIQGGQKVNHILREQPGACLLA